MRRLPNVKNRDRGIASNLAGQTIDAKIHITKESALGKQRKVIREKRYFECRAVTKL